MNVAIDITLTVNQRRQFEQLATYKHWEILRLEEDIVFYIAINSANFVGGCFEFHEVDDQFVLAHMHVSESLQRKGIGKAILKAAVELFGYFELPSVNEKDYYHYIDHGKAFIISCFEDEILKPPFRNPGWQ